MAATATTLTNLIGDTANLLGDTAGTRWSQVISATPVSFPPSSANPIQWYLNEAADIFAWQTGVYRQAFSIPVTAGTPTVAVEDGNNNPPFGRILRLEDEVGRVLLQTDPDKLDILVDQWKGAGDTPLTQERSRYWIRGLDGFGTVRLFPTPGKTVTYKAYVTARPVMMTAGTNYPFTDLSTLDATNPAHWHHALPFYAAWRCLLMNGLQKDVELAQLYKQEFDARVKMAQEETKIALERS